MGKSLRRLGRRGVALLAVLSHASSLALVVVDAGADAAVMVATAARPSVIALAETVDAGAPPIRAGVVSADAVELPAPVRRAVAALASPDGTDRDPADSCDCPCACRCPCGPSVALLAVVAGAGRGTTAPTLPQPAWLEPPPNPDPAPRLRPPLA